MKMRIFLVFSFVFASWFVVRMHQTLFEIDYLIQDESLI